MKKYLNYALTDKILKGSLRITVVLLIGEFLFLGIMYPLLPPAIPLFNQLPWGQERLVNQLLIFFPVLLAFVFFILNLFFANYLYKKMPLVSRILGITTILLVTLSGIVIIQTVLLMI
jgi:hypothetical protein